MIMKRMLLILFAMLAFLALQAKDVLAHAKLDSCMPAPESGVATAPAIVKCLFTEEIDTKQSTMSVFDASNTQVDKKDAKVDLNDPNRKTLVVSLDTGSVKNGVYTVKYHVVTPDDNGVTDGSFKFTVGQVIAPPPTPTRAPFSGKISIVTPKDGATLPAGQVTVRVAVEGVKLGPDYHWHLLVDDKEVAMVEDGKDSTTTSLNPGAHELGASIADEEHDDLASTSIKVTATGSTLPTTGGTLDNRIFPLAALGLVTVLAGFAVVNIVRR